MLRKKFLIRLGLLICAFVLGAAGAVWMLQDVQADLDRVNGDARQLIDGVLAVGIGVNEVIATRGSGAVHDKAVRSLGDTMATLGAHGVFKQSGPELERFTALRSALPVFEADSPEAAAHDLGVHRLTQELATCCREHVAAQQAGVASSFRMVVLALTLAALVMVNVSILVMFRTTQLVLRPVEALVAGSRELAAERFDHRVEVDKGDEFAELAHAYNALASHLQHNEERKTETLRQLAVTLNHELNNSMAIIEMQLSLLDRRAGQDPAAAKPLREIRAGLVRMSGTVSSLKDIRRIVLTDYAAGGGQKMIDLARSVAVEVPTSGEAKGVAR